MKSCTGAAYGGLPVQLFYAKFLKASKKAALINRSAIL